MQQKSSKNGTFPRSPNLPKRFDGRSLPGPLLEPYGRYSGLSLAHDQLSAQSAEHLSFEQMLLKQVNLHGSELTLAQMRDVCLNECDLANANWPKADLARVEVLNCRLVGFHIIEARLQDLLFKHCQVSLAQFRFTLFRTVRFEHCDLSDADFQGADLSGVAFVDCNLSRAEMSGAKLTGADLRGSVLDGLHVGWQELQGATVDPNQALALVRSSGVIVEAPAQGLPVSHEQGPE